MSKIRRWIVVGVAVCGATAVSGLVLRAYAQDSTGTTNCTIHFTDGKTFKFKYPIGDVGAIDRFVQALGTATTWVLELDGKSYIVPTHNVAYLEMDPAVRNYQGGMLKGSVVR